MHARQLPRSLARWAPLTAAILGSAAIASPAGAAVANPNDAIVVTSNTSDLLLSGPENVAVTVDRPTIGGGTTTIATGTSGSDPAAPGESGINSAHIVGTPADGCWDAFTPQLLAGDVINLDNGDSTTVAGVTAEPLIVDGNNVIVHGTAFSESGGQLPADEIDAQLFPPNGKFDGGSSGGQFLSAQAGDGGGSIAYDAPGSNNWTAHFNNLGTDTALAKRAQVVGAWTGPAAATGGGEETDFEVGATPGPNADCAGSPYAPNEPRSTNATANTISSQNTNSDLTITGVTQPGTNAVTVTLRDRSGRIISASASGAGTWSATVPGSQLATLADGAITIGGTFNNGDGTFRGGTLTVNKDTVGPAAPSASVAPGTYPSAQTVALSASEGTEAINVARTERPDVVLLDIGLPGIDGYEVARRLLAQADKRRPALVAMTGYGQAEDRKRAREAGFALHLVKPVEPDALKRALAVVDRAPTPEA